VAYLPVKTTATFVGPGLGVPVTSVGDVKLNTTDYVIRLGYRPWVNCPAYVRHSLL